ncbi:MAG: 4-hydroxy-tetrahydrodipicolinate reductase [Ignavibacteriae bacterium]|nr:4-hydroxy-tetrahydrodipicolinate reductase [Ignavibacteriota bacterium]MCB9244675.1 4-hydroxy-tetrahydrodipicolinate reductase [Ignavibacteriales bacterium]
MDIYIIGYGKMGKEVEKILTSRNHSAAGTLDIGDDINSADAGYSICIDFTTPDAFKNNYKTIADKFAGAVVGTTGWNDIKDEVTGYFKEKGKSLVYASNFSVGVNIFFDALERLSSLTSQAGGYNPYVVELHHSEKKDAPSGTAKTMESIIEEYYKESINIASVRSGNIKGIHEAGFDSNADRITLKHEALSREGFALGAVMAAEWLTEEPGVWNFRELLNKKLKLG